MRSTTCPKGSRCWSRAVGVTHLEWVQHFDRQIEGEELSRYLTVWCTPRTVLAAQRQSDCHHCRQARTRVASPRSEKILHRTCACQDRRPRRTRGCHGGVSQVCCKLAQAAIAHAGRIGSHSQLLCGFCVQCEAFCGRLSSSSPVWTYGASKVAERARARPPAAATVEASMAWNARWLGCQAICPTRSVARPFFMQKTQSMEKPTK